MRRRLLRHPLAGGIDPEAAFRALAADGGDVFWLDSGRHGVHVLGSGARILPERGEVMATLKAELLPGVRRLPSRGRRLGRV